MDREEKGANVFGRASARSLVQRMLPSQHERARQRERIMEN